MLKKYQLILSLCELDRLTIYEDSNKRIVIANVHGLKCSEAKRFINNLINIPRESFRLIVIHGYNRGTAIKDMLQNDFNNKHIVNVTYCSWNKGITNLILN